MSVKTDMSELWKHIFKDSDAYMDLVIDESLNLDLCAVKYSDEGMLTSMIVGVPYMFYDGLNRYSALYLCGISTHEDYRSRGEIQRLMNEIENKARNKNFDFLFLVPATPKLRCFYRKFGYVDTAKRSPESSFNYAENLYKGRCMDICPEKISVDTDSRISTYDPLSRSLLIGRDCLQRLKVYDSLQAPCALYHTPEQWRKVLIEHKLSGFPIRIFAKNDIVASEEANVVLLDTITLPNQKIEKNGRGEASACESTNGRAEVDEETGELYGMMKPLRENLPAPTDIGFTLLLD